jgi:hypothetical protein
MNKINNSFGGIKDLYTIQGLVFCIGSGLFLFVPALYIKNFHQLPCKPLRLHLQDGVIQSPVSVHHSHKNKIWS